MFLVSIVPTVCEISRLRSLIRFYMLSLRFGNSFYFSIFFGLDFFTRLPKKASKLLSGDIYKVFYA